MLTKICIRRFKRFNEVEVPLGNGIVFVGPNNSGKTSALEAIALWHAGLQEWIVRRMTGSGGKKTPTKGRGITINRKSLVLVPTPHSSLLWHNRKVMHGENIHFRIELTVHGLSEEGKWKCGLEFDYATPETFHCRPLRLDTDGKNRMLIPAEAKEINLALLPPMSGLAADEPLIQEGRINVLLGQGRTAEVLRNICYSVKEKDGEKWKDLVKKIELLFGMMLNSPEFRPPTGDIELTYKEGDATLDLQCAGRGVQQVILLLAFLYYHKPGTVLMLDEPDAHLEILRQDAIYELLNEVADKQGSQIIAASHSERLLNIAASRDAVVSFVGIPHSVTKEQTKEVRKALSSIGWEYYYQSEILGWVLYLEGESDKKILLAFAKKIQHRAITFLSEVLCKYIGTDKPSAERGHFTGLRDAKQDLVGILLMDNASTNSPPEGLTEISWRKREIENYICTEQTLLNYASDLDPRSTTAQLSITGELYRESMKKEIRKTRDALAQLHKPDLFSDQINASEGLEILMENFSKSADVPRLLKRDFYKLVEYIPDDEVDSEIKEKLDAIENVYKEAKPSVPRSS